MWCFKANSQKKGFTLAELLIVVAIIAILVAIAIPIFKNNLEKSREAYDIYTMRQAASAAIDLYNSGVKDEATAKAVGLAWWGNSGASNANAWGVYDPGKDKFYPDKKYVSAYGKGTTKDGGTQFTLGNSRGAYSSTQDYTDAIVMIAIYPNGNNKHVDVYWKQHSNGNAYIGGAAATSDPKYSIRISLE